MRRFRVGPTTELLAVFAVVFLVQIGSSLVGVEVALALFTPLVRPWSIVTSIYAHDGLWHLLTNAVALAIVGFALERSTSRFRFHAFVLATGALAGLAQWFVGVVFGTPAGVIGASGAVLALYGYVVSGNPLTAGLLSMLRLGRQVRVVLLLATALLVTALTAGPGVALVAHFVGFALGAVAGRLRLLRVDRGAEQKPQITRGG